MKIVKIGMLPQKHVATQPLLYLKQRMESCERESIVSIGKQDLYLTTKNVENSWHFVK